MGTIPMAIASVIYIIVGIISVLVGMAFYFLRGSGDSARIMWAMSINQLCFGSSYIIGATCKIHHIGGYEYLTGPIALLGEFYLVYRLFNK